MSSMTTVFSDALKILNLWTEKGDKWLSLNDLWSKKERLSPSLKRKSKHEFGRYLTELVRHNFVIRQWDSEKGCYCFAKVDEVQRKSFASIFVDFAGSVCFGESRDALGASVVFSQPALTDFMTQEEIEKINVCLDNANGIITDRVTRALMQKKIEELPDNLKADANAYPHNARLYDEMRRRLELSGKVKTEKEDKAASAKMLVRARLEDLNTVEDFKAKAQWRFNRMMKDIPLTLNEYEEYQRLERKISHLREFFEKMDDQIPKFLCCFWNFGMEEYFLEKHNFIVCVRRHSQTS